MVFSTFTKTITNIPNEAVLRTLDHVCKMLQDDLENDRLDARDDAFSIICFKQFVQMVKFGGAMRCTRPLPPDHLEFYRETIVRLVQAKELPASSMEQFEQLFPVS